MLADHEAWYAEIQRVWPGYEPRADGENLNNPHAEDEAIYKLPLTKQGALVGPAPDGNRVLNQHNVPFRLWTEAQRENSARWRTNSGSSYSTDSFQEKVRKAVEEATRDGKRAARLLSRVPSNEDAADIAKTAWAGYRDAGSKWGRGGGFSRKALIEAGKQ